jgi:hypothetical protein
MQIQPQRVKRRPESAQDPVPNFGTRRLPATPPLTPESGTEGWSPLDVCRQHLEDANVRISQLDATCSGLHRTLIRKEAECDDLRRQLAGVALVTPVTGPAISALRAAKKKRKRNR